MELYILDSLYRRVEVIDVFESLIWTERRSSCGDFELHIHPTLQNRKRLLVGTKLACDVSYRVMIVESVDATRDLEGRNTLIIKGRSLELILESRVAAPSFTDLFSDSKWTLTGKPADIARQIFHDICVTGVLDSKDVIPGIVEGSIFPEDTIQEPDDIITYEISLVTVLEALTNLCDQYDLGYRIVRHPITSTIYFDVYSGSDRSSQQSTLPAVVFSPNLDNLNNTSELTSRTSYRNVAYVVSKVGNVVVTAADIDPNAEGFERSVLLVKADDITDEDPDLATEKMIQKGKEELSKCRVFSAFDGEVNQTSSYVYGTDYHLTDLVDIQNVDGAVAVMQVTEQIFVHDKEGVRSYPTLSVNKFITPGSWAMWDYNKVWEDMGPTEYWANA
jgi:hypothetical protein